MLVLSRRDGEEIAIGDNVKIKVLSSGRGRVRIGIEAPRNVSICRSELPAKFDRRQLTSFDSQHGEVDSMFSLLVGAVG